MRRFTLLVMFISLSVIGSLIKIPFTIGSIALDSAPAVVAAVLLGPTAAAVVASVGHVVSALFGGFPLGPLLATGVNLAIAVVVSKALQRAWGKQHA